MFRLSCANCHFCNLKRPSDLTLADFWGWEKTNPKFNLDDKGCSLVLCNTPKGKTLFDNVSDDLYIIPTTIEKCMQTHLRKPSTLHSQRMEFESDYVTHGFEYVLRKYCTETLIQRLRRHVGVFKRTFIRKFKMFFIYR